jgi:hypothetical protein
MKIDLLDAAEEDLLKHIEPYSRFLGTCSMCGGKLQPASTQLTPPSACADEAERKGEVALVHCKSGNSRAAALCIAHLMRRHRWCLFHSLSSSFFSCAVCREL